MAKIAAGSRAAYERALKAAETRRRNADNRSRGAFVAAYPELESIAPDRSAPVTRKLRNPLATPRKPRKPPAFPKSYHATPTRHITRDLRMKEPKRGRHSVPAPRSAKAVRAMSNAELARAYNYWWKGIGRDRSIPVPARMGGSLPYTIRDEYQKRAVATHGDLPRIKAHQARRGVRKERGRK